MLTKDNIKAKATTETAELHVAALDGTVTVRGLTGSEREQVYNLFLDVPEGHIPRDYRATLAMYGLCEADGRRMFADVELGELAALPYDALKVIAKEVERLSGLGVDADEAAGNSDGEASA